MSGMLNIVHFVGLYLLLAVEALQIKDCDRTQCKGPIRFYEEALECTPIYGDEEECCPIRYDCPYLKNNFLRNKCYSSSREYDIGEESVIEDRFDPCSGCTCEEKSDGSAKFVCAYPSDDCVPEWCYIKNNVHKCEKEKVICSENLNERYKCEVDGEIYLEGEFFIPKTDFSVYCHCGKGYNGENVEPFCRARKCKIGLRSYNYISRECVPVFNAAVPLINNCMNFHYRCKNEGDFVISKTRGDPLEAPDEMKCKFGNLTMNIGDEINKTTSRRYGCSKCICEVPPIPTCQQIPDDECDRIFDKPFAFHAMK